MPTPSPILEDLERRLVEARGADREIDARLYSMARGETGFVWIEHYYTCDQSVGALGGDEVRRLTSSIESALSLVEQLLPKWDVDLSIDRIGPDAKAAVQLRGPNLRDEDFSEYAESEERLAPPLAICLALVRALQQEAGHGK